MAAMSAISFVWISAFSFILGLANTGGLMIYVRYLLGTFLTLGGRGLGVELFSSLRNSNFKNHVGRTILMQNFSITHLIKAKTIAKLCPT